MTESRSSTTPSPAVFLHIQKTAGTSIVDIARMAYGNEYVTSHGDCGLPPKKLEDVLWAKGVDPGLLAGKRFISGHFGFDYARRVAAGRYLFTFLRNPVERILSYYYFCRGRDPAEYEVYALARNNNLEEFLKLGVNSPAVRACIWNNQAWQLAKGYGGDGAGTITDYSDKEILDLAIAHLDDMSYFGFAETFEFDRNNILIDIGIEPPAAKVVSNQNPGRPRFSDLPESAMKSIEELVGLDKVLYGEAWARRTKSLAIKSRAPSGNLFSAVASKVWGKWR